MGTVSCMFLLLLVPTGSTCPRRGVSRLTSNHMLAAAESSCCSPGTHVPEQQLLLPLVCRPTRYALEWQHNPGSHTCRQAWTRLPPQDHVRGEAVTALG